MENRFTTQALLIVFSLVAFAQFTAQTTYTWTGGTSSSFTTSTNWSPNGTPSGGDNVVIDGNVNCTVDDNIAINDVSILSTYTGTFDCSNLTVFLNGDLDIAGGTFISTSADLEIVGNLAFSGGTFSPNGGNVVMYLSPGITSSITGNITFNQLTINHSTGALSTQRSINLGTCTATDVILTGSAPFNYQGSINILGSLTIGGTNTAALSTNTGTFVFSGAGPISISGASSNTRNRLPNIQVNTTGTISATGNINVMGNWVGSQGTWTQGTSNVNFSGTSASISGTASAFDNLVVLAGASVSFPSAQEVKVAGSITRTGTLTIPSDAILGLNGTGAQSLSGTTYTLGGLRVYSPPTGSRVVTLSTGVDILDFVQVQANCTLASGSGNLALRASSSGSGRVASLPSGASITGSVVVETFLPGTSTGWANLGIRGVTNQTVKSWDTYVSSVGANGIPMTCNGCDFDENSLGSYFVSIQAYDESTGGYTDLTSSSPLNPGTGYWTYVGSGSSITTDLKLVNTGTLVQGSVQAPVTSNGTPVLVGLDNVYYNLVANPYPSPVSWFDVQNNTGFNFQEFNDAIYVWNADLSGGAGDFAVLSGGVGSGGISDEIPGGQGFYVEYKAFAFTGYLEFNEFNKVSTSSNQGVLKPASTSTISLFRLKIQGATDNSETVIRLEPNATSFYDGRFDAHKLFKTPGYLGYNGPYTKYTTISTKDAFNTDYAINAIPPLTQSVSIPVLVRVSATGTYSVSAFDFQNFNPDVCVGLIDKLDNSYHDLRAGAYSFTINDTTSTPRFTLVLCKDNSISTVGVEEKEIESNVYISQDLNGAFVATAFPVTTKANISAYNLMGQKIMEDIQIEGTATQTRLNLKEHGQVVFVTVTTSQGSTRKKMILH